MLLLQNYLVIGLIIIPDFHSRGFHYIMVATRFIAVKTKYSNKLQHLVKIAWLNIATYRKKSRTNKMNFKIIPNMLGIGISTLNKPSEYLLS